MIVLGSIVLVTAWWNVAYNSQVYGDRSSVPPDVDRFLTSVRAVTPPDARVMVIDTWQDNVMFVRALYVLQPRRLYLLRVPPHDFSRARLSLSWAEIQRRARVHRARYVTMYAIVRPDPRLFVHGWLIPAVPRGLFPPAAVRLRVGKGLLVEVAP